MRAEWLAETPALIWDIVAVVLGLAAGSFANVLIYRLPRGESIVRPASRCPNCGRQIRAWENIPVLSWLFLRGHCAGCHAGISIRYPLVEICGGICALLSVKYFGYNYAGFAYGALFLALIALVIIDLQHWLLPFAITLTLTGIGLLGALFFNMRPLADSLLGMLVGFALFSAMLLGGKLLFKRDAMGGGDVVFGAMAGVFLGWKLTILMVFVASFLGTLISIPFLILGKNISGRAVPFGPFLAAGLVFCVFFGEPVVQWYVGLVK